MDTEVFKNRILPIKNKLYRFAFQFLKSEPEAQDVVQDVFIKLWNKRGELDQLQSVEAYSMTLIRNLSLDRLKAKRVKITDSIKEDFDVSSGENYTPYSVAERQDAMNKVGYFIDQLPDKQRQVILLRDVEGYSYKEIGEALEMDMSQVKINLFRARKSVKEKLLNINAYGLS